MVVASATHRSQVPLLVQLDPAVHEDRRFETHHDGVCACPRSRLSHTCHAHLCCPKQLGSETGGHLQPDSEEAV